MHGLTKTLVFLLAIVVLFAGCGSSEGITGPDDSDWYDENYDDPGDNSPEPPYDPGANDDPNPDPPPPPPPPDPNPDPDPIDGTGTPLSLDEVEFWGYQIQGITETGAVNALAASSYDMLVLEPTCTDWSSDDRLFDTKAMVKTLKATKAHDGVHRKLVIAYIDIGEAEDWRWYWDWPTNYNGGPIPSSWPDFIVGADPDGWYGNYPVAYWDPAWQDIMIYGNNQDSAPYGSYSSAMDEIIKDGFDGVYLDWVEGFEDDNVIDAAWNDGVDPMAEMVKFIQRIRDYGKSHNPDFIVIQQNASALIDGHPELTSLIDGIAQEGIWFDGDATDDWNDIDGYDWITPSVWTGEYIEWLGMFADAGIPIFNCEYALNKASTAYSRSKSYGYIPYVTRRSLGRLTTTRPPGM